jgi:hypothetical protein
MYGLHIYVWISMRPARLAKVQSVQCESLPLPEVDRRGKYFLPYSATAVSLSLEIQKCPSRHSLLLTCRRLHGRVMDAARGAGSGQHLHVVGHGMFMCSRALYSTPSTVSRIAQRASLGETPIEQERVSPYPRND